MPHTHILRAHLKGYRNIRDTEATFSPGLNILIGPNGSGKTNFLWLLANIITENFKDLKISAEIVGVFPNEFIYTNEIIKIRHEFSIDKKQIEKIIIANNSLYINEFSLIPFNIPNDIDCFSRAQTVTIYIDKLFNFINSNNRNLNNNFFDRKIKWFNNNEFNIQGLNFDEKTIRAVQLYSPVKDIRVEFPESQDDIKKTENGVIISNLIYKFKVNGDWFYWNELSDGTRRIVWIILTVLSNNIIILIEEPELGIHPLQVNKLMEFLKEQSEEKQIIVSTHAPEVLNILGLDELDSIKICKYDELQQTTLISNISKEAQAHIQKYMREEGFLSDYWIHIDLENTKQWT